MGRRGFLKATGLGALGTLTAGGLIQSLGTASAATTTLALAATDGYVSVPGRPGDPLYIFGFIPVDPNASVSTLIQQYKGHAQTSAPTLDFRQGDDIKITPVGRVSTQHGNVCPNEFAIGEGICSGDSGGPAFDLKTGALRWSRQMAPSTPDVFGCTPGDVNCGERAGPDFDFGASPAIVDGRMYLRSRTKLWCIGEK